MYENSYIAPLVILKTLYEAMFSGVEIKNSPCLDDLGLVQSQCITLSNSHLNPNSPLLQASFLCKPSYKIEF